MKVTIWHEPKPEEIEVTVTSEQIRSAITEMPDSCREAVYLINDCAAVFKAISDDLISDMNSNQRKVIGEFLEAQSQRFLKKEGAGE